MSKSVSHGNIADQLAYVLYQILEGDDVDAYRFLRAFGYVDNAFEWIYPDEEDDVTDDE